MNRIYTKNATGVATDGRWYAGDINALQDVVAAILDYAQTVGVGSLAIGEAGLQLLRYTAGEARLTGALRTDGILRALGGLYGGAFTTSQRNALSSSQRPYGLIILNTTANEYEWNAGTDITPNWLPFSPGITAGSITVDKLDTRMPNPMVALGLMMVEGVVPYLGNGDPQLALKATFSSAWDVSIASGRAFIQGDDSTVQGMYLYARDSAGVFTFGTHAPATNPRWDILALQFNDADYTARTPVNAPNFVQVVGTPNAAAAIGNPNNYAGLPSLPPSAIPLAYVLVKNTDASLVSGQIVDVRKAAGPGVWGEDGHRYRIGVTPLAKIGVEPVT